MRVVVFGTGKLYHRYKERMQGIHIVAFLDNDMEKQGTYLDGRIIDLPCNIFRYAYDYILLASVHYKEMREQLIKEGVDEKLIIDREHRGYLENIRRTQSYEISGNRIEGRNIVLVSHDLSLTGAPLMLYYAALILKENGYGVTLYTRGDGPLRHDYLRKGISVSLFENFDFSSCEIRQFFSQYQMILVNTVVLHELVGRLENLDIPVVWWLHEEESIYREYNIRELPCYKKLSVYGVGIRAINAYKRIADNREAKQLLYGIPSEKYSQPASDTDRTKLVFAIIGRVSEQKGHDILRTAIRKNQDKWKAYATFWIIGNITSQEKKEWEKEQNVTIFGSVDHSELTELYKSIDVVVCPSRHDTMPVVLAEGMMHKKICIMSDATGTSEKVEPYVNGLICRSGDPDSLSKQIDWVLQNRDQLKGIGENAFETYKTEFSLEKFQKDLLSIIAKAI